MGDDVAWTVMFSGKAKRHKDKLTKKYQDALDALRRNIELNGPAASNWPHYGKSKGTPRYVATWKVTGKTIRLVEGRHVGTHEKADYGKIF
jgi:hypothetical protein